MKRKIELDRMPHWRDCTDAQWATIQAHSVTLAPIASVGGGRAALWQNESRRGRRFTEFLDFLLKDIANKHRSTLERLARESEAAVVAPIGARNNHNWSQCVRIGSV